MIPLRLVWLVLEGILIGFFLRFGSSEALGLAIVLFLIPLVTIPINLYVKKKIHASLAAEGNLRKGGTGEFILSIVNPTVFPVLRVGCSVQTQNQLNRQNQTIRVYTWLPPRREQKISVSVGSDYCGRLRLAVPKVVLYDCFGLLGIWCKVNTVGHLTVQPDTFEPNISLVPNANCIEESDVYSQERPGADLTETFQIREYVPGDSPRQVHWKLSSKFDRLIVRDPALPITRNVLIFWERTGESGDIDIIDAQAEVIVSICKGLLDQSVQFTIGWNDTDRNLCILHEIHDMDELIGMIPRLMRATGIKEGVGGVELLLQTGAHALCAHMVYVAEQPQQGIAELERYGHVTKLLCGTTALDGAIIFDPKHYVEQLSQIDL